MPTKIEVRQNEVIVVRGAGDKVSHLFTIGMNPCIGLVLWHPSICALGHFDKWESLGQCAPLIACFARCRGARKAVIVGARGSTPKNAWHSEGMNIDLTELMSASNVSVDTVRPRPLGEPAQVQVALADGGLDYAFAYARPEPIPREPVDTQWVNSPTGQAFIRFGFYAGDRAIRYVQGSDTDELKKVLGI